MTIENIQKAILIEVANPGGGGDVIAEIVPISDGAQDQWHKFEQLRVTVKGSKL